MTVDEVAVYAEASECAGRRDDDCHHHMHDRCPGCHAEMYAPAVWAFSHGIGVCGCGHRVTPSIHHPGGSHV